MIWVVLWFVLMVLLMSIRSHMTNVRRCYSISCKHNRDLRCAKKEIVMYDNGALGICLYHTEDMNDRVVVIKQHGEEVGKYIGKIELIREIKEKYKDTAIKDPNEFERWMKRMWDIKR